MKINLAAIARLFGFPSFRWVLISGRRLTKVDALALNFLILSLESSNKRYEYLYYKDNANLLLICSQRSELYFIC